MRNIGGRRRPLTRKRMWRRSAVRGTGSGGSGLRVSTRPGRRIWMRRGSITITGRWERIRIKWSARLSGLRQVLISQETCRLCGLGIISRLAAMSRIIMKQTDQSRSNGCGASGISVNFNLNSSCCLRI